MKLLVLGGARFLGRHLVDAALARGDEVTIFTRGRLPVPWQRGVVALTGDRDPRVAPGLGALAHGTWDAAIDCTGYVPRVVDAGARLLASRVPRYLFVSSMSVYAKTDRPNMDESTPVSTLDDPDTEQVMAHYGGLKAACEAVVEGRFGTRATLVRPGLIVGPFDGSDRFGYWVARFVHPRLLGDRVRTARARHCAVDRPAAVAAGERRRQRRIHDDELRSREGRGPRDTSARRHHRRYRRVACDARQRGRVATRADRGCRAHAARIVSTG